ncbi:MAG: hypothetical protein E7005_01795 [Alphaproteobacteria bacterium]|nr:hypothetical protein [Alphaproteobacteria bacterium]
MVEFIKKYWFGCILSVFSLFVLGVVLVVSIAPHNDKEMKGFSVCTYGMANELSVYSAKKDILGVVQAIVESYVCYVGVMFEGLSLWSKGEQKTPWENYLFEQVDFTEFEDEDVEPISEDLLKANKLNDEEGRVFDFSIKESIDE